MTETATPTEPTRLAYPEARRGDVVDDYHGTPVADPYRWLEDPDSEETRAWVEAQNRLTSAWLAQVPAREAIRARLTRVWDYERYDTPFEMGGRYFYSRNDGLQNQAVLYVMDALDAEPRVLLDPNTLSADGTVALSGLSASEDGRLLAYGLSTSGSDWQEWKVRDVQTGRDLADHLKWIKFSGATWNREGTGFWYARYDQPSEETRLEDVNYYQKLYFHRIGTSQAEDELVYERRDQKEWGFATQVSEDGRWLVITVWKGAEDKTQVFHRDLSRPGSPIVELLTGFQAAYNFVGNDGPVFWFHTDDGAPRHRVIALDTRSPARESWKELIPEGEDNLSDLRVIAERFVALYLKDARSVVRTFALDGAAMGEIPLPGIGTAVGFSGRRDDRETFYSFTSFTTPTSVWRHDFERGESQVFRDPKVDFDPSSFETRQVFVTSRDGTRVPMFVTHRKGMALTGANPTLLYGYGGFNVNLTPFFSI
ncbi:S9 family peptidase, partial [Myxococcota bacterium]|nr:S9 family peptidase [Myxococcota bacterium]